MHKKTFAVFLAMLLTCLFCLSATAAPSQDELDGKTPYELTVRAIIEENGSAILSFRIDELGRKFAGMDEGDDIHVKVEYRRGDGDWNPWYDYSSQRMFENQTTIGVFELKFDWVFDNEWDGVEPIYFRACCEYMQGGNVGTGLRSDYSNVAFIGIAGEGMTEPVAVEIVPIPYDEAEDTEEPIAPPTVPGVSHALLLCFGVGLLLVLLIIILVVISKKKKRK